MCGQTNLGSAADFTEVRVTKFATDRKVGERDHYHIQSVVKSVKAGVV